MQPETLDQQDHEAILGVCILAAFADGEQADLERTQIERIVNGFTGEHLDLVSAYQDVLGGKLSLAEVAGRLHKSAARALAYEMAVCVCNADGVQKDTEKQFLAGLRQALQIDSPAADRHEQ